MSNSSTTTSTTPSTTLPSTTAALNSTTETTDNSTSASSTTAIDSTTQSTGSGLPQTAIYGIIGGSVAVVLIIIFLIFVIVCIRRRNQKKPPPLPKLDVTGRLALPSHAPENMRPRSPVIGDDLVDEQGDERGVNYEYPGQPHDVVFKDSTYYQNTPDLSTGTYIVPTDRGFDNPAHFSGSAHHNSGSAHNSDSAHNSGSALLPPSPTQGVYMDMGGLVNPESPVYTPPGPAFGPPPPCQPNGSGYVNVPHISPKTGPTQPVSSDHYQNTGVFDMVEFAPEYGNIVSHTPPLAHSHGSKLSSSKSKSPPTPSSKSGRVPPVALKPKTASQSTGPPKPSPKPKGRPQPSPLLIPPQPLNPSSLGHDNDDDEESPRDYINLEDEKREEKGVEPGDYVNAPERKAEPETARSASRYPNGTTRPR